MIFKISSLNHKTTTASVCNVQNTHDFSSLEAGVKVTPVMIVG